MTDRLAHHAEGASLKGDSCRPKGRDLGQATSEDGTLLPGRGSHKPQVTSGPGGGGQFSTGAQGEDQTRVDNAPGSQAASPVADEFA
jgi:hypothetical protein